MKTTEIPISRLLPAAWYANRVPARTLTKIRNSIERFGVVENLVARPHPLEEGKLEVISGNHRLQILAEMGFQKVPVVLVDVDDAHARLLAQTLNRTRGEDDPEAYAALLEHALAQVGQQTALTYLNETESSLNRFLNQVRSRQLGDVDDAPEPPAKADSKPGTVYELGPHRVACGDATDPAIWKQLLDGEQGHLVLTDPPYGVDYGEKTRQMASRSTVRARSDLEPVAV